MSAVWDFGPQKQGPLLVMLALADYANDQGECWPSMKSIAEKARMTERGAQKILRQLEADGWVKIETGNGRKGCNRYAINHERRSVNVVHPEQETPNNDAKTPNVDAKTPNGGSPEPSRTVKEPSEILTREKSPPKKRAMSLPENWVPSDANITYAISKKFSPEEIEYEADKFRDHHLAKGTAFKDWDAGWRNWIRNAIQFGSRGPAARHSDPDATARAIHVAARARRPSEENLF